MSSNNDVINVLNILACKESCKVPKIKSDLFQRNRLLELKSAEQFSR